MKDDKERDKYYEEDFRDLECDEQQCPFRNQPERCPYMQWVNMWREAQRQMPQFGPGPVIQQGQMPQFGPGPVIQQGQKPPLGPGTVIQQGQKQGKPEPTIIGGPGGPPWQGGPGGPPWQGGPGGPPWQGGPGGPPAQGNQPPKTPPPNFTPRPNEAMSLNIKAVDTGALQPCRFRFSYIWLKNGRAFWAYLVFVGRRSVAGWRYTGRNWVYFGVELRDIRSFTCY